MAGRSGRRRVDPGSPLVDLDAVFADDALVDSFAGQPWGGDPARFTSSSVSRAAAGSSRGSLLTVDPLTELLELWRQELAVEPMPAPPDALGAVAPVQRRPPSRKRTLRPALAIAAAIGALLVGAASIGSKDAPRESPLFVLTQVLWPNRVVSVASADQVDAILLEARTAIQDGRTQDAQLALLRATVALGSVDDVDGKGDRQDVVAALWVEVAPQPSSTGTQPNSAAGAQPTAPGARPAAPGTRSAAASSTTRNTPLAILAAPATDGTTVAAQPAGPQVAAPQSAGQQIVLPAEPSTGAVQAALGAGWPTAAVTPPPIDGPAVTESAAPSASAAPVVPVVTAPPVVVTTAAPPSVPSTPPPPTVPVDPPAEVSASEPPSATEQSPPAPTPSEPSPAVETTATDSAGPISSTETVALNKLDPAATATG